MRNGEKGFTLIELLVVMAIIATLMTLVAPRFFQHADQAKVVVRDHNLNTLRSAIDHFRRDRVVGPYSLNELIEAGYLREMPLDPITNRRDTWEAKTDDDGQVVDIEAPQAFPRQPFNAAE